MSQDNLLYPMISPWQGLTFLKRSVLCFWKKKLWLAYSLPRYTLDTPTIWNELPDDVCFAYSVTSLWEKLQSHLFWKAHSLLFSQCLYGYDHWYARGLMNFAIPLMTVVPQSLLTTEIKHYKNQYKIDCSIILNNLALTLLAEGSNLLCEKNAQDWGPDCPTDLTLVIEKNIKHWHWLWLYSVYLRMEGRLLYMTCSM